MAHRPGQDSDRGAVFSRRLTLLAGAQLLAFGAVGWQLYGLQVERGDQLAEEGLEVITKREFTLPRRGTIADRAGRPLAFNRTTRVVLLRIRDYPDPSEDRAARPKQNLDSYATAFSLSEGQKTRIRLDIDFALGLIPAEFYLRQLAMLPGILQAAADFVELAEQSYLLFGRADQTDARAREDAQAALDQELRRETFVTVDVQISAHRHALVQVRGADMPLIELATRYERRYEAGEVDEDETVASISHVLGYTRRVFREDLFEDTDPLLNLPGARIGAAGIERSYDRTLRGIAGETVWQITGGGRKLKSLNRRPPTPGEDLNLTIDLPLQKTAINLLSAHPEAAAVVMNVQNGEILALASQPSYDVNDFVPRISTEAYGAYLNNPFKPLFARASQGTYPPGSTFKMIATLAAQIYGFSPQTTWNCSGSLEISDQTFRCWKRQGHGRVDMRGALRESCDVWFYQTALELGLEPMREVAAKFGFGQARIENFLEQSTALLPSRQWKVLRRGEDWVIGDSVQFAIGQGFMLATPVQLAAMTASLCNGGYAVRPHLVRPRTRGFFDGKISLGFEDAHLRVIREAMSQVVNSDTGTAHKSELTLPLGPDGAIWRMAGKTGTAQVTALPPDESDTINEDIPYDQRDHALFVGYAPRDDPKYACAVVVEHGGSGSATAAPLARDLLATTLARHTAGHFA